MITGLDHIAIAVPDLEKAIARFMSDFGLTFEGTEEVLAAKTTTAFFRCLQRVSSWSIRWPGRVLSRAISRSAVAAFTICAFGLTILIQM